MKTATNSVLLLTAVTVISLTLHPRLVCGGVTQHADLGSWLSAVGTPDVTLPFGDYAANTQITTQYQSFGVLFSGDPQAPYASSGGDLFNNQQGISDTPSTIQMDFPQPLTAVAIDLWGAITGNTTLTLLSGATQLSSISVPPGRKDINSRLYSFHGFEFTSGTTVDRILLDPGPGPQNGSGLDNLRFSVIPEPSTSLLAAFGILGLLGLRCRRR